MDVDKVLTADILLPTWNVEERKPALFSGLMASRHPISEYMLPLNQMVFASASDPVYFDAANLSYIDSKGKNISRQFIGGSCIAENPAMYSYLFVTDFLGVDSSKITVTTVGAQQFQQTKIDNKVTPFQWF
jgi:patatin-like phospholipase/acyl hydrolase